MWTKRVVNKSYKHKTKIIYSLTFFSPCLCFVTLLDCQTVRELIRGDEDPKGGQVGLPPWSDLPLNHILYYPLVYFAYSSYIFRASLHMMDFMLSLGTWKYSRFFLSSSSFRDHTPVMILTSSTLHPWCYIVFPNADLRDSYCPSVSHLTLITSR